MGTTFSYKSVCWGYRKIFKDIITGLEEEGYIGDDRPEVTETFYQLLSCSEEGSYDHVLKEFLFALSPETRWIMNLPALFEDVVSMGRDLAGSRLYYGIGYFRTLGQGGFGDSPEQVRNLLLRLRRLRNVADDAAFAFLKGYRRLSRSLTPREMDEYINQGITVYRNNPQSGIKFLQGELKSSDAIIRSLTKECRLEDISRNLEALTSAIAGYKVEVSDLGKLDSDELIERGTSLVCYYKWLYLPVRVRDFDEYNRNRSWFTLMAVASAGLLAEQTFASIHGHCEYPECSSLVGESIADQNLFQILEITRAMRAIYRKWPGARRLLKFGFESEFTYKPPLTPPDCLLHDLILDPDQNPETREIIQTTDRLINTFDTANSLNMSWREAIGRRYGDMDVRLRALAFLPDFTFPGQTTNPPADSMVADMKDQAKQKADQDEKKDESDSEKNVQQSTSHGQKQGDEESEQSGITRAFLYDEWSQPENDYYENYCSVMDIPTEDTPPAAMPEHVGDEVERVRKLFEMIRPDTVRREKYLDEGDFINPEMLVEYMVSRQREPSPRINFYEKPVTMERDMAVILLVDSSGSTGEEKDTAKVIEIEKNTALIIGEALHCLGDRFMISGFSSQGRERCEYIKYKEFDDNWNARSIGRILAAYPRNSTRIGPALRHSGWLLSNTAARRKLIILITDGKPMDTGYDPNTQYAQYDIRMANEENLKKNIATFAISTQENTCADMDIMFPSRRYVILKRFADLPRILPRLYLKLTT